MLSSLCCLLLFLVFDSTIVSSFQRPLTSLSNSIQTVIAKEEAQSYVIIQNLQYSNIGSICRNCMAFNVKEVIVVGRDEKIMNTRAVRRASGGSLLRKAGQNQRIPCKYTESLFEAINYVKQISPDCIIIGVEITEDAIPILSQPFSSTTVFLFGNEGDGLNDEQKQLCDKFVYIPQYNKMGIASLNVACASAIVLQSFAVWARFDETQKSGGKFIC